MIDGMITDTKYIEKNTVQCSIYTHIIPKHTPIVKYIIMIQKVHNQIFPFTCKDFTVNAIGIRI